MTEYYFEEGCFITELSNTPQHPDLSIARARVPDGVTTRWHRVKDIAERVVIPSSQRQRIANIGDNDLVFLAICTPRFERAAYEDLE